MTPIDRRLVRSFDYGTLLNLAAILSVGIMLVASASAGENLDLARRQGIWMGVGIALATVIGAINYRHLTDNAYLIWGGAVLALVGVLIFGARISGARSWIRIGSLGMQPSEFAKIAVILALARLFSDREPRPFGLREMVMPSLIVAIPMMLIVAQPDQGTAATFLPILAAVAWVAGLRGKTIATLAGFGLTAVPLWFVTLKPYQRARLTGFWNPEADPLGSGYQLLQSKIAVGSGGLTGKGLLLGTQSQLNFLPEQENDFIMALMGEELGFIGVALVLLLYLSLLVRLLRIAYRARDRSGAFVCVGLASLLAFHVAVNAGMVIGYLPITGIPLPMLSYGGSATLATCLGVGLAISVRNQRFLV